jgi:ferredoxin
MTERTDHARHPKNAPGPFYVADEMCITCGMPELEAPDLITGTDEGHCYFATQPTTPEELEQAIRAVGNSCCGAVTYDGDDPVVLKRIADLRRGGW